MNTFLQKLGYTEATHEWKAPVMDGNVLVTADGFRWRIEHGETVADLLHVGDTIRTSYDTGGLVIGVHKQLICSCPYSEISRTKICHPHWDGETNEKYHIPVIVWSITFVRPGEKQSKSGDFREDEHTHCGINELVAFDGRILKLFEANNDEVFIEKSPVALERPLQLRFM